mmetsp:Transcript_8431/g.25330  ORF Transcript_8431/g.25330 Transcript_8431/m.25330 type:complete len:411 (-) Transcript_8431:1428-2660(-)|eukprot:CAMPEP_0198728380 /NCGR_PEP_ID=MMETSP1475-20131203/8946_1 /TAXON_ID= ORGANISM="Unidentified sp., Strain CCMP1999" /NCGR_SAMPLE_ID=MMETSP1475 /ASSEMBLY_ACC=CAM_ASM_001111 /LENGTH=410 /DNA_ID=CAMNT_0044490729 /DNA_START=51 /DNA_END=1283 /DNA_ORIENTATION=+
MGKDYDIVVFGATGFTGKFVVEELKAERDTSAKELSFAACGRSAEKLRSTFPDVDVLVADAGSKESMVEAFSSAKVVINATGPYRFYGAAVMDACADADAHYVDVCGEPAFLEKAVLDFDGKYQVKALVAIGSCGFDSLPADLGTGFTTSLFGTSALVNIVKGYHIVHSTGGINVTTLEAALHSFANAAELSEIRKKLPTSTKKLDYPGGRRPMITKPHKLDMGRVALPFPGADASVVRRSQATLSIADGVPPVQFHAYFTVEQMWSAYLIIVFAVLLRFLILFPFGIPLILKYPEIFSNGLFIRKEPPKEVLDKSTFEMRFVGEGFQSVGEVDSKKPTRRVVTRFGGGEPFYRFTALGAVQSARCILDERDKMPDGGVFTPYIALRKTTIMDRLRKHGVKIEVVSDETL